MRAISTYNKKRGKPVSPPRGMPCITTLAMCASPCGGHSGTNFVITAPEGDVLSGGDTHRAEYRTVRTSHTHGHIHRSSRTHLPVTKLSAHHNAARILKTCLLKHTDALQGTTKKNNLWTGIWVTATGDTYDTTLAPYMAFYPSIHTYILIHSYLSIHTYTDSDIPVENDMVS